MNYSFKRFVIIIVVAIVSLGATLILSENNILTDEIQTFYKISTVATEETFPFIRNVIFNTLVVFSLLFILVTFKSKLSKKMNRVILTISFFAIVFAQIIYIVINGFNNAFVLFENISLLFAIVLGIVGVAFGVKAVFFKRELKKEINAATMMEYLCLLDDQKGNNFLKNLNNQGLIQQDTRQKMLKLITGTKENPILAAVYTTIIKSNVKDLPKNFDYFLGITHEHLIFAKLNKALMVIEGKKISLDDVEKYKNKRTVFFNNTVRLKLENGEKIKLKIYNNFGSIKEQQDELLVFEQKFCGS